MASTNAVLTHSRLPHSNRTYLQCDVAICKGACPEPKCGGRDYVARAAGPLSTLITGSEDDENEAGEDGEVGGVKGASDPFERAEDDSVTTSTSVFVAQPGSEEAGS